MTGISLPPPLDACVSPWYNSIDRLHGKEITEMIDETNNNMEDTEDTVDIYTLVDEEGNEMEFQLLAEADIDGAHYVALAPAEELTDAEEGDYVILQQLEEDGEKTFVTVDDDETLDRVAEFFDDLFFSEVDCD